MAHGHVIKNVQLAEDELASRKVQIGKTGVEFVAANVASPHLDCHQENGVIRYIDVHCSCGQVIRIECEYTS